MCIPVYMSACIYVFIYLYMYVLVYACMCVYVCMYVYVYVCIMCMYVCVYIYVCIVIRMNISMQNNSSHTPAVHWFLSWNRKIDLGYRVDVISFFYTLSTVKYITLQYSTVLYALPTLYLCALYLSENKQPLVSLTAQTDWFL